MLATMREPRSWRSGSPDDAPGPTPSRSSPRFDLQRRSGRTDLAHERSLDARPPSSSAARTIGSVALVLTWSADCAGGAWLEGRLAEWSDRDERMRWDLLWYLAIVEVWAGRWSLAAQHGDEVHEIAARYGIEGPYSPYDRFPSAFVALHQGKLDVAREHSRRALELGEEPALNSSGSSVRATRSGGPDAALANFVLADRAATPCASTIRACGSHADHVEALLQLVGRGRESPARRPGGCARKLGRERDRSVEVPRLISIAAETCRPTSSRGRSRCTRLPMIRSGGCGHCSPSASFAAVCARSEPLARRSRRPLARGNWPASRRRRAASGRASAAPADRRPQPVGGERREPVARIDEPEIAAALFLASGRWPAT
jgi:hypothetical protein